MGGDFSKNLQSESLMSFGNVPEDTSTLERVDFASDPYNFGWCADNPLQCSLATVDFLPVVGTLARCGQLAVQALDDDIREERGASTHDGEEKNDSEVPSSTTSESRLSRLGRLTSTEV